MEAIGVGENIRVADATSRDEGIDDTSGDEPFIRAGQKSREPNNWHATCDTPLVPRVPKYRPPTTYLSLGLSRARLDQLPCLPR